MILKTSTEWFDLANIKPETVIIDADGWDRANFDFSFEEEKISKDEFSYRLAKSTINITECEKLENYLNNIKG
jgi:hypothetical protein